ncbi:MAG: hypothetical protein PHD30_05535 [Paludibacter sp.]|nr:hypothetical protein [Paludibacter sp.]
MKQNFCLVALFEYNLEYSSLPQTQNNVNEKIYSRHLSYEYGDKSTDINSVISIKLSVTDSILHIMHKDYSMLEKFKEYYMK